MSNSQPPSSRTDRQVLEDIERRFTEHAQADLDALGEIRSQLSGLDARAELIRASQGRTARQLDKLEAAHDLLAERTLKVETAHGVDMAARAGSYSALAVKATADALEHSANRKKAALKVAVAILLALLGGLGIGEGARQVVEQQHEVKP